MNSVCRFPGCGKHVKTRGLCNGCYIVSRKLIKKGLTTDEAMVRRGIMPPRSQNRGVKNQALYAWMLGIDGQVR